MIVDTEEYEQLKQIKTNLDEQLSLLQRQQQECNASDQWTLSIINSTIHLLNIIAGVYQQ